VDIDDETSYQPQLYYNVVRPDFGPEWQLRVQVQVMLPKTIFSKK
jgi:hypothetical protein